MKKANPENSGNMRRLGHHMEPAMLLLRKIWLYGIY